MAKGQDYYATLTRAIDDIVTHGYDSPERIMFWEGQLRKAAERSTQSTVEVDRQVGEALAQIYKRMIERGGLAQYHQGVGRFTIERLRPQLRAELDKSIRASANIIKLNREKRMAQTLQRFSGWATSVPKGGSRATAKREEKENLRKPIANLKFEQRRVEVDQAHKLVANLNRIVALDGGAIAATWTSHFRQSGYKFREDHKERDYRVSGNVWLVRNSWAHREGLVKPASGVGYLDGITQAGEEPFCRCFVTYIYALRDVPEGMLTRKGEAALEQARTKIKQLMAQAAP